MSLPPVCQLVNAVHHVGEVGHRWRQRVRVDVPRQPHAQGHGAIAVLAHVHVRVALDDLENCSPMMAALFVLPYWLFGTGFGGAGGMLSCPGWPRAPDRLPAAGSYLAAARTAAAADQTAVAVAARAAAVETAAAGRSLPAVTKASLLLTEAAGRLRPGDLYEAKQEHRSYQSCTNYPLYHESTPYRILY